MYKVLLVYIGIQYKAIMYTCTSCSVHRCKPIYCAMATRPYVVNVNGICCCIFVV